VAIIGAGIGGLYLVDEIMREAASQWRRLADDSEAHERRLLQLS
jgi:hypothetical protein